MDIEAWLFGESERNGLSTQQNNWKYLLPMVMSDFWNENSKFWKTTSANTELNVIPILQGFPDEIGGDIKVCNFWI